MDKQILDLAELIPDRPVIKFRDGSLLGMKTINEFSLMERIKLRELGTGITDGTAIVRERTDELMGMLIPDSTGEMIRKLTDSEVLAILNFFTQQSHLVGPVDQQQTGEN